MGTLRDRFNQLLATSAPSVTHATQKKTHEAIILTVSSQKGGVGKTTSAISIATGFHLVHHKRVLLIDLDPQGHIEKSLHAIIPEGQDYIPLAENLSQRRPDILQSIVRTEYDGLDITPGDKELYDFEAKTANRSEREYILKSALHSALKIYDIIVIDTPPNLGILSINALVATHHVIIPCEMSALAFEGVADLLDSSQQIQRDYNSALNILGVLFTRVDNRNSSMNRLVVQSAEDYYHGKLLSKSIKICAELNRSQLEGRPIYIQAPQSRASKDYKALLKDLVALLWVQDSPLKRAKKQMKKRQKKK